MADEAQVTIGGVTYQQSELNNAAKVQLKQLQVSEQEIAQLKRQLAIAQTARAAYAGALKAELPEDVKH
ncbi:DUF6447 family protein [Halomonas sp. 7T]|uniref:DUF6447 family protein n=1 Tax=Halomonas sp. 7T TaxID=2893469 RepID=UPI0021D87BB6|nr:DUF6447 family protein [Halomonas sp. 7T]UXZ55068.1 DUF6447 family protein [Halomonas sp. 7T]